MVILILISPSLQTLADKTFRFIVIPLFLFRASNILKYKAWPKHTRTLDDLFEDAEIEALKDPIEKSADCCCLVLPVFWLDKWIRVWQRIQRRRAGRMGTLAA